MEQPLLTLRSLDFGFHDFGGGERQSAVDGAMPSSPSLRTARQSVSRHFRSISGSEEGERGQTARQESHFRAKLRDARDREECMRARARVWLTKHCQERIPQERLRLVLLLCYGYSEALPSSD